MNATLFQSRLARCLVIAGIAGLALIGAGGTARAERKRE